MNHLSPEAAVAHAYGLADEAHSCPECARRFERLRADRELLAEAVRSWPESARRRPWPEAIAATVIVAVVASSFFFVHRAPETTPAAVQDVDRWIEDLGNDDLETRDRATAQLRALGEQAESALRQAVNHTNDAEIRGRLLLLLWEIEVRRSGKIATGGPGGKILLWSVDGRKLAEFGGRAEGWAQGLTWSPDGRRLAYLIDPGLSAEKTLYILEVDTGTERLIEINAWWPVWSPDSRRLAFGSSGRVLVDSGTSREIAPSGTPCFWSSDGKSLFVQTGSGLDQVDVASGTSTRFLMIHPVSAISDGSRFFYFGPSDGRRSYARETYPLLSFDRNSGTEILLAEGIPAWISQPPFPSADGRNVAFVRWKESDLEVCVLDVGQRSLRVVGLGQSPSWSPDGTRLVYARADGQTSTIVDLSSGNEIVIEGTSPAWSR